MRQVGFTRRLALTVMCFLSGFIAATVYAEVSAVEVELAESGRSLHDIVVVPHATQATRRTAATLAHYLQRISGATFAVVEGDGRSGLLVAEADQVPGLAGDWGLDVTDPLTRDRYILRTHEAGLFIVGMTAHATRYAMWDVLHRLGYRQFFPTDVWKIVPHDENPRVAVDADESPDYVSRLIWAGYGQWPESSAAYEQWLERNRMSQRRRNTGFDLRTGHAYEGIIERHRDVFEAHPEYLALVDGKRAGSKFCIANPDLRQLVARDVVAQAARRPDIETVPLDPSDGDGWCQCDACAALGSISDRAVILANAAAEALVADHPDKYVTMYAYARHAPPPSVSVHPHVIICVATRFITGGHRVEGLLDGWRTRGAKLLGIRDYYSIHAWDRDLPGRPIASNIDRMAANIRRYHQLGAYFLTAEASNNWGPAGLSYYIAARLLWDSTESVDAIKADFFARAFGQAADPMARFYALIDGGNRPLLSEHLLATMYRALHDALAATTDERVRRRIEQLVLYTRYVELFRDYDSDRTPGRQAKFEALMRLAYRIKPTPMIHAVPLFRDLAIRDKAITVPEGTTFQTPEDQHPWKDTRPFTTADVAAIVADGVGRHKPLAIEPINYSDDLVPASALRLAHQPRGNLGHYVRGRGQAHLWIDRAPAVVRLEASTGHLYDRFGDLTLELIAMDDPVVGRVSDQVSLPPDQRTYNVELRTQHAGLHRLVITEGGGSKLDWGPELKLTWTSSLEDRLTLHYRNDGYFYVPPGVTTLAGYSRAEGEIHDADGNVAMRFKRGREAGYFTIRVDPAQAGRAWKLHRLVGTVLWLTPPPQMARSPRELLLPREVVEAADRKASARRGDVDG